MPEFVNIYVYSDSLAFPRPDGPHDLSLTYPFQLRRLVEERLGVRTNIVFRGRGGADVRMIHDTLLQDSGYVSHDPGTCNIAVIQVGIVDCAPRPFTYAFIRFLRHIPFVGGRLITLLKRHRRGIQRLGSYRATSPRMFRHKYLKIVADCRRMGIKPVAVGLPLPPTTVESRSPGFRISTAAYNALIQSVLPEGYCDIESGFTETTRASLLRDDGHHLTMQGHEYYAEKLFGVIRTILEQHQGVSSLAREPAQL